MGKTNKLRQWFAGAHWYWLWKASYLCLLLNSMFSDSLSRIEVSQSESIYTTEIGKCYKSGLFSIFLSHPQPKRSSLQAHFWTSWNLGSLTKHTVGL